MALFPVYFFQEDVKYIIPKKRLIKEWICSSALNENKKIIALNYILCSDEHLLLMNKQYLKHDYYTDIITFDNSEEPGKEITGDIFISIDRIRDNAKEFKTTVFDELCRVMIHGALHLCGYDDHGEVKKMEMKRKEDYYLQRRKILND